MTKQKTIKATFYFESALGGLAFEQVNLIDCGEMLTKRYQSAPDIMTPYITYKKKGGRNILRSIRESRDLIVVEGWNHPFTSGSKEFLNQQAMDALSAGGEMHVTEFNYGDKAGTKKDLDMVRNLGAKIICDYFE